jgi:hypothetical protein
VFLKAYYSFVDSEVYAPEDLTLMGLPRFSGQFI